MSARLGLTFQGQGSQTRMGRAIRNLDDYSEDITYKISQVFKSKVKAVVVAKAKVKVGEQQTVKRETKLKELKQKVVQGLKVHCLPLLV